MLAGGRTEWAVGERVRVYRATRGKSRLIDDHDDDDDAADDAPGDDVAATTTGEPVTTGPRHLATVADPRDHAPRQPPSPTRATTTPRQPPSPTRATTTSSTISGSCATPTPRDSCARCSPRTSPRCSPIRSSRRCSRARSPAHARSSRRSSSLRWTHTTTRHPAPVHSTTERSRDPLAAVCDIRSREISPAYAPGGRVRARVTEARAIETGA